MVVNSYSSCSPASGIFGHPAFGFIEAILENEGKTPHRLHQYYRHNEDASFPRTDVVETEVRYLIANFRSGSTLNSML